MRKGLTMDNIILPTLPHSDVSLTQYGRVEITMHDGYKFYDRRDYVDDEGNFRDPEPNEISYSRYGVFSPLNDFDAILVVVAEDTEDTAIVEDYQNALSEFGVEL